MDRFRVIAAPKALDGSELETLYVGTDGVRAWDVYRGRGALERIRGCRSVILQRYDDTLSGVGGWVDMPWRGAL